MSVEDLVEFNLAAQTRKQGLWSLILSDIFCLCVNISCEIACKVLARIDNCNKITQARDGTLNVEASDIEALL